MRPVALIVAVADNGVIGRDNSLPWHLPRDLAHFKRVTMGKPLLMGRRTFESIGRPLPGRPNIVISRSASFAAEGVHTASNFEEGLERAQALSADAAGGEIMVIGGSEIYKLALPYAQRIYLTEVHIAPPGDTRLPELDWSQWQEVERNDHPAASHDEPACSFVVYERLPR